MRHKKYMGHGVWNNCMMEMISNNWFFAYQLVGLNTKILDFEDLEFMN